MKLYCILFELGFNVKFPFLHLIQFVRNLKSTKSKTGKINENQNYKIHSITKKNSLFRDMSFQSQICKKIVKNFPNKRLYIFKNHPI